MATADTKKELAERLALFLYPMLYFKYGNKTENNTQHKQHCKQNTKRPVG